MKKLLLLFTIIFFITISYSQDSIQKKKTEQTHKKTPNDSSSSVLLYENINHSGEIQLKSDKQSLIDFLFPSLIAILIGGLALYGTIITSKKQLISNKEALEQQTNSSIEIAKLDFRKTVLSTNRQNWINELRELISDLISLISLHIIDPSNIKSVDSQRINFLIIKAEFMLNPIKDSEYIDSIVDLKNLIFDLSMEKITLIDSQSKIEIVKQNTKKTLKTEWERVKNGE